MIRRANLAALVLLTCSRCAAAVHADEALHLAERLVSEGRFGAATVEYRRYLFFHGDGPQTVPAYQGMALCLRRDGQLVASISAFRSALRRRADPELRAAIRTQLSATLIGAGEYVSALEELNELARTCSDIPARRRGAFLEGVAHLYRWDWDAARGSFAQYYGSGPPVREMTRWSRLQAMLDEAEDLPLKSPRLARRLSSIVPGSGQAYAGDWRSAGNALCLNALTGLLVLRSAAHGDHVDAGLLFGLVFSRYYFGNRQRAERAVQVRNARLSLHLTARILELLQQP